MNQGRPQAFGPKDEVLVQGAATAAAAADRAPLKVVPDGGSASA